MYISFSKGDCSEKRVLVNVGKERKNLTLNQIFAFGIMISNFCLNIFFKWPKFKDYKMCDFHHFLLSYKSVIINICEINFCKVMHI